MMMMTNIMIYDDDNGWCFRWPNSIRAGAFAAGLFHTILVYFIVILPCILHWWHSFFFLLPFLFIIAGEAQCDTQITNLLYSSFFLSFLLFFLKFFPPLQMFAKFLLNFPGQYWICFCCHWVSAPRPLTHPLVPPLSSHPPPLLSCLLLPEYVVNI